MLAPIMIGIASFIVTTIKETIVLVTEVPMLAPMMIGIASFTVTTIRETIVLITDVLC